MRRSLSKIPYPVIGRPPTTTCSIGAALSTSSSGGGGGGGSGSGSGDGGRGGDGRGRGHTSPFQFTVGRPSESKPDNSKTPNAPPPAQGRGHGRGQPLPSSPVLPSFSSFLNNDAKSPQLGRGRGHIPTKSVPPLRQAGSDLPSSPKPAKPILGTRNEPSESAVQVRQETVLPDDIETVLSGAGRGKLGTPPAAQSMKPKEENRHARPRQRPTSRAPDTARSPQEELSQEEKVKKAVEILSRGDTGRGTGRGARGGRGRGRGRFGRRGRGGDRLQESDDEADLLLFGDPAAEQKFAEKVGAEVMNKLAEGLEEVSSRVLPSPIDDDYLDAYHTNMLIECEPEYLMEEFGTNPDIDDNPPIPLSDAFEKMKPFLMPYLGIVNQEDWEEIMKETMETVPLIKEIVEHYSGPDRVTAKQQIGELESVAKTLPVSAPASVKRFTDRALLSLQSNPGWGFDKKCQFMDKLVMEVSQQYK